MHPYWCDRHVMQSYDFKATTQRLDLLDHQSLFWTPPAAPFRVCGDAMQTCDPSVLQALFHCYCRLFYGLCGEPSLSCHLFVKPLLSWPWCACAVDRQKLGCSYQCRLVEQSKFLISLFSALATPPPGIRKTSWPGTSRARTPPSFSSTCTRSTCTGRSSSARSPASSRGQVRLAICCVWECGCAVCKRFRRACGATS